MLIFSKSVSHLRTMYNPNDCFYPGNLIRLIKKP